MRVETMAVKVPQATLDYLRADYICLTVLCKSR